MSMVETVLGPLDASKLGVTLSHEHVLAFFGEENHHYPWRFDWAETEKDRIAEWQEAKAGGIDSMIDLSTPDLGRDVELIRRVAQGSGVNMIVATGLWRDIPRSFFARDVDRIAGVFVREIEVGIDLTNIKAGVIKVANDEEGVTEQGEKVLRGAARALKRTGCPISTHHWAPGEVGRRQVEVFRDEGAPMDRICIGHSADTTNVDYLESLLQQGVYLSMDRYPGGGSGVPWEQRNATVKALIDRGWAHKLMLGHDWAPPPVSAGKQAPDRSAGPPTRYLFVQTVAIPALRQAGVSKEAVELMTRTVPRRFLTGEE